jgi:hypothetical protein
LKHKQLLLILLLTFGALLIHGYHPWAEDAEIYIPGVEKTLHPELFPFNAQFFEPHAHATFFPNLVAALVRLSHLRLDVVLLVLHVAAIFLFLLACWELLARCHTSPQARWGGVALVAALLTLPVAGTALYLMDQYLNPRNLSAFALIFGIVKVLDRKYLQGGLFLVPAAAIHPLMSVFAFSFCVLLVAVREFGAGVSALALFLPFGISFDPPPKAYHQVALTHAYLYLTHWEWYEWLGVIGPIAVLWWLSRVARARQLHAVNLLCRTLIIYELIYLPPALLLSTVPRFEALARLQPMRCLYLLYVLMLLFAGAFLGEHWLKNRVWRWLVLFVPLCVGMFVAQRLLFPGSAHLEWPWSEPKNQWEQAFLWIRENTPNNAIFALDPLYMDIPNEDEQGFRAIARRGRMADEVKDSGAVSMFPVMADEWVRQVQALDGWKNFKLQDFRRLQTGYGVDWLVLQQPGLSGLECPYHNETVEVCSLH